MSPDVTTLNDALIEVVKSLGGSKSVAPDIWPAKGVEPAQRHLLACLNQDRPEKLALEEVLHILRMGREKGQHSAMEWLCEELGYTKPTPISKADESDRLRRQLIEASELLARTVKRIEALEGK